MDVEGLCLTCSLKMHHNLIESLSEGENFQANAIRVYAMFKT